jgi:hypothetical protein
MRRNENFRLFDHLVGFQGLGRPLLPQCGRAYEPVQKGSRPDWKKRRLAYAKSANNYSMGGMNGANIPANLDD